MTLINPTKADLRKAFRIIAARIDKRPTARWHKIMQEQPIKKGKVKV